MHEQSEVIKLNEIFLDSHRFSFKRKFSRNMAMIQSWLQYYNLKGTGNYSYFLSHKSE